MWDKLKISPPKQLADYWYFRNLFETEFPDDAVVAKIEPFEDLLDTLDDENDDIEGFYTIQIFF